MQRALSPDLLWLRRLATLCLPLGIHLVVRAHGIRQGNFLHFDLFYPLVTLVLLGGACLFAWLGRFRGFVLLAISERAVSGLGALLYLLGMVLPASPDHTLRYPAFIAWNLLCVALAVGMLAYFFRKYPAMIGDLSPEKPIPLALRVVRGGLVALAAATMIDVAPMVREHLTEQAPHLHTCHWMMTNLLMAAMMACAFVAGLRRKWRTFVAFGLVSSMQMAFCNLFSLANGDLYRETWGTLTAPVSLSRNLVVLAFSIFSLVYLALRFPPDMTRAGLAPSAD